MQRITHYVSFSRGWSRLKAFSSLGLTIYGEWKKIRFTAITQLSENQKNNWFKYLTYGFRAESPFGAHKKILESKGVVTMRRIQLAKILVVITLVATVPKVAKASTVIIGGTDNGTSSSSGNFMHGFDFTLTANMSVTDLGFWDNGSNGLPRTFQVGLWNTTTQALLASAFIDNSDALDLSLVVAGGSWRYETLGSAVNLSSGQSYTLAFQAGPGGLLSEGDSFLGGFLSFSGGPNITLESTRRFENGAAFVFPTGTTTFLYTGNVNAKFAALAVPEPSTLLLLSAGLMGLGVFRRITG